MKSYKVEALIFTSSIRKGGIMRQTILSLLIGTVFVTISCEEASKESLPTFTIEGTVFFQNHALENATVRIEGHSNLSTVSDESGKFVISNVPEGDHVLKISKSLSDGSFTETSSELSVEEDLILNFLQLPRPAYLFEPTQTTSESTQLRWNATDAADFREYKIYRHSSSGLDESTGELIHISTSILDTSFIDSGLDPLSEYYYRVYVMNDFGRLGGSNIVHVSTLIRNLFPDGGFETSQILDDYWNISYGPASSASISDSLSYAGSYALKLSLPAVVSHDLMMGARAGDIYELSFYYRLTGDSIVYGQPDDRSLTLNHFGGSNIGFSMFGTFSDTDPGPSFDSGWLFYSNNYLIKEDTPIQLSFSLSTSTDLYMWFDNFELKKVF